MNRTVFALLTILCLLSLMSITGLIQAVKADGGTITINADGSITPSTAPITTVDNTTYAFTGNVNEPIVVERDSIVVDGQDYTVQGTGNGTGITLSGISNVLIENTNIENFGYGVFLENSSNNNTISWNNITNNGDGLDLYYSSSYNRVGGNNIIANYMDGIHLFSSSNNNSVSGNNITANNIYGISLDSSNFNSLSGNNVTNNGNGMALGSSSGNSVSGNSITASEYYGMWLDTSSDNNSVSGNNITARNLVGIYLDALSNNNSVSANNISNNYGGIFFDSSSNNSIVGNNVANDSEGIYLEDSSGDNSIFHNSFVNNTQQVVSSVDFANVWDDGYPSGGNYWSDYNGTDANHDGIGDTPYIIDANNADHYPLMTQYVAVHDVAVTNVTSSKTVIGQGFSTNINVTVANQGDYTETFNVTTYINPPSPLTIVIVINITTVRLDAGKNITISLAWNTTGLAIGDYTVSAAARPVLGETNTTDNTFSVVVKVTIPGDINGDFKVSLIDLVLLANAYGSTPQTPSKWNPNADINGNGIIDLADLVILAQHYGQHNP